MTTITGHSSDWRNVSEINIAELFAGVGGFRLGLEGYADPRHPEFYMKPAGPFRTIWANQWEPPGTKARQFAARCYMDRFGNDSVVNEDINKVLEQAEAKEIEIPDVQMVVGGFPCQDYSVARPLNQAHGIEGKKGVLWWDIYHFLEMKKPKFGLFENVDRLLKSPASQRGRDFAIILSCLADLDYTVEWRVVNSAEYGFPQRRKRVYIFCEKDAGKVDLVNRMHNGVMAKAFPAIYPDEMSELDVLPDPYENSTRFGVGQKTSQFKNAGVMQGCHVLTCDFAEDYHGERHVLGDVLVDEADVPEQFYISDDTDRADWLSRQKPQGIIAPHANKEEVLTRMAAYSPVYMIQTSTQYAGASWISSINARALSVTNLLDDEGQAFYNGNTTVMDGFVSAGVRMIQCDYPAEMDEYLRGRGKR